jgi:glycosyltransferase involved in cell wall biosynthesis
MKTAIIHEWLTSAAGSEKVLEQMLNLYPDADLYCIVDFMESADRQFIKNRVLKTSLIQHLPFAKKKYRNYLPLMPFAVQRFDLSKYDLILSSSHAVAKGVRTRAAQLHICYCHTPMRYAWDLRDQYLKESGLDKGIKGAIAKNILNRLQAWDAATAARVDYFLANSYYIADRIKRAYNRESDVIYPPVDVDRFSLSDKKDEFYLAASRMVPYKKMDLIAEAFTSLSDKRLIIIGNGPDFDKVRKKAGKNISLLGYQPFQVLKEHMQRAKAFVFAAEEDFGIVPVEAQACGTPVIAFGRGGVTETVLPLRRDDCGMRNETNVAPTGVFFNEQTPRAVREAVLFFEKNLAKFDGQQIRKNAIRFSTERFKREFKEFVAAKVAERL